MAGSLNTQSGQQRTGMERNYRVSPDGVHVYESFSKPIHRVEEFHVEPVHKPNFFTIFQEENKLRGGACRRAGEMAPQLRAVVPPQTSFPSILLGRLIATCTPAPGDLTPSSDLCEESHIRVET